MLYTFVMVVVVIVIMFVVFVVFVIYACYSYEYNNIFLSFKHILLL